MGHSTIIHLRSRLNAPGYIQAQVHMGSPRIRRCFLHAQSDGDLELAHIVRDAITARRAGREVSFSRVTIIAAR